jgi:hypothetical protein
MTQESEFPVTLTTSDGKRTNGTVVVQFWDRKQRRARALKAAGISLGLAVVSILIPLAHFILVPSFLVAAFVIFPKIYNKESGVVGGKGICPNCNAPFVVVKGPFKWPIHDLCDKCQHTVTIEQCPKP